MFHFPPRRILVAVDFSAPSAGAFAAAEQIAAHYGARLEALYCDSFVPAELSAYYEGLRDEASRRGLDAELQRRFGSAALLPVARGEPVSAILSAARRRRSDMIVVGTHGRRGVARAVLGSVAESVLRHSPLPVLVVRKEFRLPRRVLAPIREDRDAARGLASAGYVARSFKAAVTVLHVVTDPVFGVNPKRLLSARLNRLPPAVRRDTRPAALVRLGEPVKEILRAVHGHDLLVLVARRKSLLGDLVLGTTAERLARLSPIPVLTIPPLRRPEPARSLAGRLAHLGLSVVSPAPRREPRAVALRQS